MCSETTFYFSNDQQDEYKMPVNRLPPTIFIKSLLIEWTFLLMPLGICYKSRTARQSNFLSIFTSIFILILITSPLKSLDWYLFY